MLIRIYQFFKSIKIYAFLKFLFTQPYAGDEGKLRQFKTHHLGYAS